MDCGTIIHNPEASNHDDNYCYIFTVNQHLTISIMKSNKNKNWELYMLNELYLILSCVKTYIHNDIW